MHRQTGGETDLLKKETKERQRDTERHGETRADKNRKRP